MRTEQQILQSEIGVIPAVMLSEVQKRCIYNAMGEFAKEVSLDFVYWLIQIMEHSEGWKFAGKTKEEIYNEYLHAR